MEEKEKIEILYKILVNGLKLDKKTLMIYGINEDDIKRLISHRIITYDKKNEEYKLVKIEKFHRYGIGLLLRQKINEANTCFRICYEYTKNGKNICLQVLLAAASRYDYDQVFEVFANLETIKPDINRKNNNLYLYLLSMLTKCPEQYIDRVKNMDIEDIMLPLTVENKVENTIRKAIIENRFKYAYQLIVDYLAKNKEYSVKFELIRVLLIQILKKEKIDKTIILNFAMNDEYDLIVSNLREFGQQRRLSKLENSILLVAVAIVNLSKMEIMPVSTVDDAKDIHEAILGNNFELALRLNNEYLQFGDTNEKNDIISILLLKLNDLIKYFEDKRLRKEKIREEMLEIEEWAYYYSEQCISLENIKKSNGLLNEVVLLIKLIYARDYYIESNYLMGDKIINEVEGSFFKTEKVISWLEEIKINRDRYKEQLEQHTRKREIKK